MVLVDVRQAGNAMGCRAAVHAGSVQLGPQLRQQLRRGGGGTGGFVDTVWKVVDTLQKLAMLVVFAVIFWFVWSIISWLGVVKSLAETLPSVFGWTQWIPDFAKYLGSPWAGGEGEGGGAVVPGGKKPTPIRERPGAALSYMYNILIILLSCGVIFFVVFWVVLPLFRGGNYSVLEYFGYNHRPNPAEIARALAGSKDAATAAEVGGVVVDMGAKTDEAQKQAEKEEAKEAKEEMGPPANADQHMFGSLLGTRFQYFLPGSRKKPKARDIRMEEMEAAATARQGRMDLLASAMQRARANTPTSGEIRRRAWRATNQLNARVAALERRAAAAWEARRARKQESKTRLDESENISPKWQRTRR